MRHIDLFSGIGGFAYAAKQVWGEEYETVCFCDIDEFCQAVLRKRFSGSRIYRDIADLIADTRSEESRGLPDSKREEVSEIGEGIDLLTGGFPCQPFSHAGKRRGTDDKRYLWPAMLTVIKNTKPRWVIAENVGGITSMVQFKSELEVDEKEYTPEERASGQISVGQTRRRIGKGVLETVMEDLEEAGYTVWPFIIPACAINAPHRRYRVWIIGHSKSQRWSSERYASRKKQKNTSNGIPIKYEEGKDAPNTSRQRHEREQHKGDGLSARCDTGRPPLWQQDWIEVATSLCRVDDGLPAELDGLKLSKPRHKTERLKSLGNAIVPDVVVNMMKAIKEIDKQALLLKPHLLLKDD